MAILNGHRDRTAKAAGTRSLFHPLTCLLVTVLYLELLLRASCSLPLLFDGLPGALCCAFACASVAALICFLPRGARASRVLCLVWMELFTLWYLIAFFMDNSYGVFMSPAIIARETGDVFADFGGSVPEDIDALMTLPGVGRKTANVIASVVYDRPVIAVDTHVFRVSHRLGLSDGKTPQAVEKDLERHIPVAERAISHHWLILHGRYTCVARKPKCGDCPLSAWCRFYSVSKEASV